jgi:hypothetical protein
MQDADWQAPEARALGLLLPGRHADAPPSGDPAATLLLLLNGGDDARDWTLPRLAAAGGWRVLVDTAEAGRAAAAGGVRELPAGAGQLTVGARALLVLQRTAAR